MTEEHKRLLKAELVRRGYSESGMAPHATMSLGDDFIGACTLAELLDIAVTRREKVFRSVDVVGMDAAKQSYDDVVVAVEAIKSTIDAIV
jgi:hypothetical protein